MASAGFEKLEEVNNLVEHLGHSNLADDYIDFPVTNILDEKHCLKAKKSQHKNTILAHSTKLKFLESIKTSTFPDLAESQSELQKVKERKAQANETLDELKDTLKTYAEELPKLRSDLSEVISNLKKATEEANEEALKHQEQNSEVKTVADKKKEKEALVLQLETKLQEIEMLIQEAKQDNSYNY